MKYGQRYFTFQIEIEGQNVSETLPGRKFIAFYLKNTLCLFKMKMPNFWAT